MAGSASQDMLSTMRDRFTMAIAALGDSREDEIDDLRFYAGSPDNQWQWPADVLSTRGAVQGQTINARPCLTINKLPQHVRQVTNDQRQNRPMGKVIPSDDMGDPEVAEIFAGMVRHIEYISDADVAYDTACENQVVYGEGYIRILTEYADDDSFDQIIKIGRVRNSFSVYMDPMIQDPCGADTKWCFITEDILNDEYARTWPNATPISTLMSNGVGDSTLAQWVTQETVRIAEYFYIHYVPSTLNLWTGELITKQGTPEDAEAKQIFGKPKKTRVVSVPHIKWVKTNGYDVLEEQEWAGRYIPVVRVVGNEFEVEGKLYVSGIIRNSKDSQRMYNYWTSQEAEMLALAPKAPFVGYGGQFEGYENEWKTANTQNWPYLQVNPDVTDGQGTPLPLPMRAQPPMASSGLAQAKMGASEDIKSTTGQYDASLGAQGNERSGKAILARQKEGDTGTYHYVDNLARAVRYVTRQLVDLIPKIYDTARIARIIGIDGEASTVKVNPEQPMPVNKIKDQQGIVIEKVYNLGVGKYDVVVTTGPGYATKRQEALEAMAQLLQGNPELWKVAGDLFVKNMDWPGAQEMAKRFAKTIDPKLMENGDESPALQAAKQQMEAMGHEMEQMHTMLQNVSKSMEAQKLDNDKYKTELQAYDSETKRLVALSGAAAAVPISGDIQLVVKQYIREILAEGLPEDSEPVSLEPGELEVGRPPAPAPEQQPEPMMQG